jgi:hypothetical protein
MPVKNEAKTFMKLDLARKVGRLYQSTVIIKAKIFQVLRQFI